MRRLLATALLLALLVTGTALAARGDPQKRITPADQARAKSIVLRKGDFSIAYRTAPNQGGDTGFYCAAIDESDLTLTGEARSPAFVSTGEVISSVGYVYESKADSSASWGRGTRPTGVACLRAGLRHQFATIGVRIVSFRSLAFPSRGQHSVAYRLTGSQQGIRVYLDLVAIQVARAQSALLYLRALAPPPRSEVLRLSRAIERRMARAMRGS